MQASLFSAFCFVELLHTRWSAKQAVELHPKLEKSDFGHTSEGCHCHYRKLYITKHSRKYAHDASFYP